MQSAPSRASRAYRRWCSAPEPERRWGEAQRRGSFHPLLDLFVSCVANSIGPPCLSESQPARTISSKASGAILLLAGMVSTLELCVHVDVLICSYLSKWVFPWSCVAVGNRRMLWKAPRRGVPGCAP